VGAAAAADPEASPGGRPRKTDMRAAMNAILYLLRTGCPWRYLPRDSFPSRSTAYDISQVPA
jgi:putative transposase